MPVFQIAIGGLFNGLRGLSFHLARTRFVVPLTGLKNMLEEVEEVHCDRSGGSLLDPRGSEIEGEGLCCLPG